MKALVVIDMQKDFVDGVLGTAEAQAIVPKVAEKVKNFLAAGDGVVLYTRDTHFDNYMETMEGHYLPVSHCIVNTEGWQIVPEVFNEDSDTFDKHNFTTFNIGNAVWGACYRKFEEGQIESVELCGVCTDICVISNAIMLKTYFNDIPIIVDSACCAGVTPEKHAAALEVMRSCQIEVR